MSYKSILFFLFLFGLLLFGFFQYETFLYYFPIHRLIQCFVCMIALLAIFFPHVIQKIKEGENIEEIQQFIIEKYKKKK